MSAAFVTNFLKEKHLLDAAGTPLHARTKRYLADQRLARSLLEAGIEAPAFFALHLRERAQLARAREACAAQGAPPPAPPDHFAHDERLARHLASRGLCGGAYVAAHAAERARLDAAGVPEGARSDAYRLDAKMVALLEGRRRPAAPAAAAAAAAAAPAQQLLQGTVLLAQRPSAPVSPLSHWVGAELPLASWRESGASTARIMGRAELALCGRAAALGGSSRRSGRGAGRAGGGKGQCCCGWANCEWHREQKAIDTYRILAERGLAGIDSLV
jgi:hypothetical protein